ncbi:gp53-like domain-containing protein [Escherichia albertii]|uniref:gp53-like domain-containing protein n=1 Tax=Escherichia albertii TaxID=208962 RepID=UPI0030BA0F34
MQNLMPPINTPDQLFHDGDPTQGIEGTLVTADYLNNQQGATRDLQQELLNVLGGAHIQPDPKKTDQLLTALRALLLSRKNPFADIKSDGTVETALENLGLGEAAKRDVGTGENQIPDMSAWKRNPSSNRWRKLPDGTIIQMGISASGPLGSPVNITLPISFSNTNYCVVASYDNARSGVSTMVSFAALPVSPSQFSLMSSVTEQGINPFAYWIAFGD